jgi:hypothetical protein
VILESGDLPYCIDAGFLRGLRKRRGFPLPFFLDFLLEVKVFYFIKR